MKGRCTDAQPVPRKPMQIDFHHAATYAIARIAGFTHDDARVVAHASQYVDDSTTEGFIHFKNGMRFHRESTAHPMLDPDNMRNDENALSWLPFHFLPGNQAAPASGEAYFSRLICRQDSAVAREMMAAAIRAKARPHGLHRLGIAAHVFVDTFAHQGFIGQRHRLNEASGLLDTNGATLHEYPVPPIGHGQVGTCPDQPFLHWSYTDSLGQRIQRDNPATFTLAAERLCQEFQRYLAGSVDAPAPGMGAEMHEKFNHLFHAFDYEDGDARYKKWLKVLEKDFFGFGPASLSYSGKGANSWKHQALGDSYLDWEEAVIKAEEAHPERTLLPRQIGAQISNLLHRAEALANKLGVEPMHYPFAESFLSSDYKKFHDAASDQRYDVLKKILPAAGIHAA
jgi:hypothetical protein